MADDVTIWFNPSCSKCRTAQGILAEKGVDPTVVRYLDTAPTVEQLEAVLKMLGTDDPRAMIRTGESIYKDLDLASADRGTLLTAMAANPILIERPIVIVGDRAVVARPPERLLELLPD
jgi:arsenate reductase (glutaredoxin)